MLNIFLIKNNFFNYYFKTLFYSIFYFKKKNEKTEKHIFKKYLRKNKK